MSVEKVATLTGDGIVMADGQLISDGPVVEVARKCQELLEAGRTEEFLELDIEGLLPNDGDWRLLMETMLPGRKLDIFHELLDTEMDMNIASVKRDLTEAGIEFDEENMYDLHTKYFPNGDDTDIDLLNTPLGD